jgi:adenylate cyclase
LHGIAEDVLAELAKLRWLLVVAHSASVVANDGTDDVRRTACELGVRYVLDGNVRQAGRRVRVTSRLVEATTGVHIWVGRYDRNATGQFAAQDELAEAIVTAIASAILQTERQRAMRKRPENLDAWEAYQRGMWHMSKCEAAENERARTFFQHAIDLDPTYTSGHAALAWSYMMSASIFSQMSIAEGCVLGDPLVRRAIALDENDVEARARLALSALLQGDLEGAFLEAEEILSVDENCADALGVKGAALVYSGRGREGRDVLQQFLRLRPRDPARPIRLSQIAMSLYLEGNYEGAARTARQVIRHYPNHPIAYRWLAASLGQLGRAAEAEQVLHDVLKTSPSSFDMYVRQRPKYCSIEYAPMLEGLRKAGWKE